MEQLALARRDVGPGPCTLQGRFERFHRDNPRVYRELVRLARQARQAGCDRIGIKTLWEVMRWNLVVMQGRGWMDTAGDQFRLNNNWPSRYVRLIQDQEPDLRDMFETRKLLTV